MLTRNRHTQVDKKGKTNLIQKDPLKETTPNNNRPLTCLPMMWKILHKLGWRFAIRRYATDCSRRNWKDSVSRPKEQEIYYTLINTPLRRWKRLAMAWIDYKKVYDMFRKAGLYTISKRYKISDEVIKFFENIMKNWRVELTAEGKSLTEIKILRGIFWGDLQSPLLFVIAMMSFNYIVRKCTGGYKLHKSQEKINHFMYMEDIKLFAEIEKELKPLIQAVRIYSQNIGMEFDIENALC